MDMKGRRALLKPLVAAAGDAWTDAAEAAFDGEVTVATQNHIYRFHEGVCFAVTQQDNQPASSATNVAEYLGMRILGWMIDGGDGAPRLSQAWQAGALAVLRRPPEAHREALALTSPTRQFVHKGKTLPLGLPSLLGRILPPALNRPSSASLTRINIAAAERPRQAGSVRVPVLRIVKARS